MTAVRILRLAAGGDGVGRLEDGRTVFVPRTAPGDLVEIGGLRARRRYARARVARVLEPSPDRVDPPCPHYLHDDCGGCQLQHLDAGAQRAARRGFVGDALRRIAKLETGSLMGLTPDHFIQIGIGITVLGAAITGRISWGESLPVIGRMFSGM